MCSNVSIHTNSTDTSTSNTAGGKGLSCSDKATMPVLPAVGNISGIKFPVQSLPAACEHTGVSSLKWRVRWARRLHWQTVNNFSPALAGDGEYATTRPPP